MNAIPPDIHEYFELSGSTHLVLPRVLLQSMPDAWQRAFCALLGEYDDAFDNVAKPEAYIVQAARLAEACDLTEIEMAAAGVAANAETGEYWIGPGAREIDPHDQVRVPCPDPLPPYDRGRGYVQPWAEAAR